MINGLKLDKLYDFQEEAVLKLIDFVTDKNSKQKIVMKAPTGAGKTIILIDFIVEYLNSIDPNTAFVWFCPGTGNLEMQSKQRMDHIAPQYDTRTLFESIRSDFSKRSTTFINWELVTKKENRAFRGGDDYSKLQDKIRAAKRECTRFIILVDEEHANDTQKAAAVISMFEADHIIRVSATAKKKTDEEYFEIDEQDVINAGLITKAIYVNDGLENGMEVGADYHTLLDLAEEKRKAIYNRYREKGIQIRPLVLIQFPSGMPQTIAAVEEKLAEFGCTYDNHMVSKWMSGDKRNTEGLENNDATPVYLLMKQAISTGWDCPRAKILVKLREGMSEQFTVQTVGRIRRMPERKHYDDALLDVCYVYTFDKKYKNGLLHDEDSASEVRMLFLKEKCKSLILNKQVRDPYFPQDGERDIAKKIHQYYVQSYGLSENKDTRNRYAINQKILEGVGYRFGHFLYHSIMHGGYTKTEAMSNAGDFIITKEHINTNRHSFDLLHVQNELKNILQIPLISMKKILIRLFKKGTGRNKILALENADYYTFLINNASILKKDFQKAASGAGEHAFDYDNYFPNPMESSFHIPEQAILPYDSDVKELLLYKSNAYKEYTSEFTASPLRSKPEQSFEQYCETRMDIDWVYKNGNKGPEYFSIVYIDPFRGQHLFYPDYIVKKKDGAVWIIETKGGETGKSSNNIDLTVENKFYAFKKYTENNKIHWGFVRPKDGRLYINNTQYSEDMADIHWRPINEVF